MIASALAVDLDSSQGDAILGLLERAQVPPVPDFYRLLFDYVSAVEGLFSARIGTILAGGESGADAGAQLYGEFVAPYQNREGTARALARITARLHTLDVLFDESVDACAEQTKSLSGASRALGGISIDPVLLRDWVSRLRIANDRVLHSHARLSGELVEARAELDATQKQLEGSRFDALRDPLTGLANRAGLDAELGRLLAVHRDTGAELCCAVIDVDHFKSLNDSYGHQVGDEVLRLVARALLASARSTDFTGRMGGDEFVMILPGTSVHDARAVAARIRHALLDSNLELVLGPGVLGSITASIGIAYGHGDDTISGLVERADLCLYRAKRQGRNRVVCEGDPFD